MAKTIVVVVTICVIVIIIILAPRISWSPWRGFCGRWEVFGDLHYSIHCVASLSSSPPTSLLRIDQEPLFNDEALIGRWGKLSDGLEAMLVAYNQCGINHRLNGCNTSYTTCIHAMWSRRLKYSSCESLSRHNEDSSTHYVAPLSDFYSEVFDIFPQTLLIVITTVIFNNGLS